MGEIQTWRWIYEVEVEGISSVFDAEFGKRASRSEK